MDQKPYLQKVEIVQEPSDIRNNFCPGFEYLPNLIVQHQIKVSLTISSFLVPHEVKHQYIRTQIYFPDGQQTSYIKHKNKEYIHRNLETLTKKSVTKLLPKHSFINQ